MGPKTLTEAGRIRAASGLPKCRLAWRARTSEALLRLYEVDRHLVSPSVRRRLDAAYAEALGDLRTRVRALPDWPPHGPRLVL